MMPQTRQAHWAQHQDNKNLPLCPGISSKCSGIWGGSLRKQKQDSPLCLVLSALLEPEAALYAMQLVEKRWRLQCPEAQIPRLPRCMSEPGCAGTQPVCLSQPKRNAIISSSLQVLHALAGREAYPKMSTNHDIGQSAVTACRDFAWRSMTWWVGVVSLDESGGGRSEATGSPLYWLKSSLGLFNPPVLCPNHIDQIHSFVSSAFPHSASAGFRYPLGF